MGREGVKVSGSSVVLSALLIDRLAQSASAAPPSSSAPFARPASTSDTSHPPTSESPVSRPHSDTASGNSRSSRQWSLLIYPDARSCAQIPPNLPIHLPANSHPASQRRSERIPSLFGVRADSIALSLHFSTTPHPRPRWARINSRTPFGSGMDLSSSAPSTVAAVESVRSPMPTRRCIRLWSTSIDRMSRG